MTEQPAETNWVKDLHRVARELDETAEFFLDLADALTMTDGESLAGKMLYRSFRLRSLAKTIRDATHDATVELVTTARVGTYSTITTALVLCDRFAKERAELKGAKQ